MKEMIEFRIPEEHASAWLRPEDGVVLNGIARKIELEIGDPRFQIIRDAERNLRQRGRVFFTAWIRRCHYSKTELEQAEAFQLLITTVFEPAGEECGTQYDDSKACLKCGSGAQQIGPLFLDWTRIPKGKDIAQTIANEIVVSARLVDAFKSHEITGVEFHPILRAQGSTAKCEHWYQLKVSSSDAEITSPTRVGEDPINFDSQQEFSCSNGDFLGLNLLSEVFIKRTSYGSADVVNSRQYIGTRRGLLRPSRVIVVSPRVRRLMETKKTKGSGIEIVRLD